MSAASGQRSLRLSVALVDVAREIPTALFPALISVVGAGAVPSILGLVEGANDLLGGIGVVGGAALAQQPRRRRRLAVVVPALAGTASSLLGVVSVAWQAALLRWTESIAHELHGPALAGLPGAQADIQPRGGGAVRAMAISIAGPLLGVALAAGLYAWLGLRSALALSVVPAVLASIVMVRALGRTLSGDGAAVAAGPPWRLVAQSMRGLLLSIAAFEFGNIAATLLILRVMLLFTPTTGTVGAVEIGVALYGAHVVARRLTAAPVRRIHDARGPAGVIGVGVTMFLLAYLGFALTGPNLAIVAACFVGAGLAAGAVTATESAMLAAAVEETVHAGEGALAIVRAVGNFSASAVTGILWSVVSVRAALLYLTGWMALSLVGVVLASRHDRVRRRRGAA